MKKILYLTKYELRQIGKSAILTAIVLSIFLGALFGVISAQTDMMGNMCRHLDRKYPGQVDICVYNASYNEVADFIGNLAVDDSFVGGLHMADITRPDGTVLNVTWEEEYWTSYLSGVTFYANDAMRELLADYDDVIVQGRWVSNPFELCVSIYFYELLNVPVGEVVTIEGYSFTLVGVYDLEKLDGAPEELDNLHVLTIDADTPTYRWDIDFDTAEQAFEAYRQLLRKGVNAEIGWFYEGYYDDITQMRAIFTAVDAVLIIVIVIALYSLVSMLFRQRKTQICRLKILGASNGTVAGIYCGTVILLTLAVVLLATALGIAFNYYFMDLCAEMLQYEFISHFNVYLPFVAFAVFSAVTFALWAAVNSRMKNNLATEIRYE